MPEKSLSSLVRRKCSVTAAKTADMSVFDSQDIWRIRNPKLKCYTRCHPGKLQFWRIDYWLTSGQLQDQISEENIFYGIKSDHSAVIIKVNFGQIKRGPGFWKFKASLLSDKEYTYSVPPLLESILEEKGNFKDVHSLWEWMKYKIRKHAIEYL